MRPSPQPRQAQHIRHRRNNLSLPGPRRRHPLQPRNNRLLHKPPLHQRPQRHRKHSLVQSSLRPPPNLHPPRLRALLNNLHGPLPRRPQRHRLPDRRRDEPREKQQGGSHRDDECVLSTLGLTGGYRDAEHLLAYWDGGAEYYGYAGEA